LIRTHNLEKLLSFCRKRESKFKEIFPACVILNHYYIDTCYPDIWDHGRFDNKKLAKKALVLAEKVLNFARNKIEK